MSNVNGIITGPIGIAPDIYKVLGIAPPNGNYDNGYACTNPHGKINRWAKYKPEATGGPQNLTESERRNNMYGFVVPKISTSNLTQAGVADAVWTYQPPVVDVNWSRFNDFDGYNHNCETPLYIGFPAKLFIDSPSTNVVYYDMDGDIALPENNVLVKDIFYNYLDWYPGVIVYNRARNQAIWRTAERTLGNFQNGDEVPVPMLSVWTTGQTIEMYAMLSRYSYTGEPADTPPLDHDAFYLQYESGKGHASAVISTLYPAQMTIKVVNDPVIDFVRQYYNDGYYWHVTEMRVTLKNASAKTMNIKVYPLMEDENDGAVYEFEEEPTLSLIAQGQSTVYIPASMYIPVRTTEVYVSIAVSNMVPGVSEGGTVFYKYYNFETKTWRDA